jgi:hypothetical protein
MNVKVPKPSDQAYIVATVADRLGCKVLVKLGSVPEVQMSRPWKLFEAKGFNVAVKNQLHTHRRKLKSE